ncbi:MAG: Ku protein [Candidatus Rokuibacteriota bacterium]
MAERRNGGPRTIWKGALTFGLVTVSVSRHSATRREAALPFRLLHAKDAAPIDYRRFCSSEGVEVPWRDVVKGYEYAKNRFVVLTREELARAQVGASQTIEIREFVPAQAVDLAYIEAPYWLAPTGPGGKAYTLLRAALAKAGRVGIGTFVLRQRERLIAVRPSGSGAHAHDHAVRRRAEGRGRAEHPSGRQGVPARDRPRPPAGGHARRRLEARAVPRHLPGDAPGAHRAQAQRRGDRGARRVRPRAR